MLLSRALTVLAIGLATAWPLAACGGKDSPPAVAKVAVTASAWRVALGTPIELKYRFDVAPGASVSQDYLVFLHVMTPDGTRLWGDDHAPAVPTSQWKPGQTIEYTRTRFVPVIAHLGEAIVEVGLYRGGERLPLETADSAGKTNAARSYRVGQFQFLPQRDSVTVTFAKGWHGAEAPADDPAVTWQWSQKTSLLTLRNPRRDATLLLECDTRPDLAGGPQQVTLSAGGKPIATFAVETNDRALHRIPITAAQFGTADAVVLTLDVDRPFVPAKVAAGSKDVRELGIRVYHAFLELR
jgi:hypothetical protein